MMRAWTRRRFAVAPLCATGLLVQAMLLPVAHAHHLIVLRSQGAATAVAAPVLERSTAASPHDAVNCHLCATVAHGRGGVTARAITAPVPQRALGAPLAAIAVRAGARPASTAAPRAPPAFSA
jgi:hypothetical protein